MVRTITYSLKDNVSTSDEYYSDIRAFTDAWLAQVRDSLSELITPFNQDRLRRGLSIRSKDLSSYDLLALGVMLREHGATSDHMARWWLFLSTKLIETQERTPQCKSSVKVARSLINGMGQRRHRFSNRLPDLWKYNKWLKAMGEESKSERFIEWITCFQLIGKENYLIDRCLQLADEFLKLSQEELGKYTEQVDEFLANEAERHPWRYDTYLRKSSRLEYHLGMVGNEILNREFRKDFLSCPQKVVLLPPCMRFQPESECKAIETKWGEKCSSCTPSCRIHQVTKLGEKEGFSVFMIPEELRIFRGESSNNGGMGVVGASCVLTNWGGGWDAETIGLPAQGLLLDYVGCKYHWDPKGFPTDINIRKLKEILSL